MEEFVVELSPEEELLRQIIEPLLESEGYALLRIRLRKAQAKSELAIYIDTLERKNGVVLANLQDISRLLSDVLDAALDDASVLRGRYDLEVSTPGLDRPLSKRTHFADAVGEKVKIRLKEANETGAKNLRGFLIESLDDEVVIEPEYTKDQKIRVALHDVAEANIVFDFSKLDKQKKKPD